MSIFRLSDLLQDGNCTLYHRYHRDSSTKKNSYCHVHGILSTVLQAFRFTHEALAEASYGDAMAYTGKLHSLLHMTYVANTEPHLRLLH